MNRINIFWFRRDLRFEDNTGFYHALNDDLPVLPVFILDTDILNELDRSDARVNFIQSRLCGIQNEFNKYGGNLMVRKGKPLEIIQDLTRSWNIKSIYANHDYEPYAIKRDQQIEKFLLSKNIRLITFKDQVIFEKNEIVNELGMPYKVFTPYRKKWLSELGKLSIRNYECEKNLNNLLKLEPEPVPSLKEIGFSPSPFPIPEPVFNKKIISQYHLFRDYPGRDGTSRLGIHLRHGTISIRKAVQVALSLNDTWLNELIWREFYMMILYHFPWVVEQSFKKSYDRMEWINDKVDFQRWCNGVTGYPIVDAGMRQLIQTGYMHNRARMITASFLTKHLLVDWRLGESYFASKLLDYELASNNGGWQWAAGTGTDAQPYFRIFNPELQTKKFDPDLQYVKKWVPEYETSSYPPPIIDHNFARQRALNVYKKVLT